MRPVILDTWSYTTTQIHQATVLPDGCRDLIQRVPRHGTSSWFVSALDDTARHVTIGADQCMRGFRLRPGVQVNEERLLHLVSSMNVESGAFLEAEEVCERIEDCCEMSANTEDALAVLQRVNSVAIAAQELGVSVRTLQRHLFRATGRTPVYWLQLARIRFAAREMLRGVSLVELADVVGFSDQAHMTREFQRWFQLTPTQFQRNSILVEQIQQLGYP